MAQSGTLLVGFDGAVDCRDISGAINLLLRGRERGGAAVEALFAGASAADDFGALPAQLHDVQLLERAAASLTGGHLFELRARELQLQFGSRSLQLHRAAGAAFSRAVPPPQIPLTVRCGWALLLWLLRIPGVAALLSRLRSGR